MLARARLTESCLRSLLVAVLRDGHITRAKLAGALGVHKASVTRYMAGQRTRIPADAVEWFEKTLIDLCPATIAPRAWRMLVEAWALGRVREEVDRLVARFGIRLAERFLASAAAVDDLPIIAAVTAMSQRRACR